MAKIVECVPNFSEGRDKEIIEAIVDQVRKTAGVKLLDYSFDTDHNRTVVTMVGDPEGVQEAAWRLAKKASELIDMTNHHGGHPRMGATDVIPFIPVSDMTMEECVALAQAVGKRIGEELNVPVYLYEDAANRPERKNLADVRKGQYEGFFAKINEPDWQPDYGPAKMNAKAGATAVGARVPLVAYNVNLGTSDIEVADKIAKTVRYIGGGLRFVKAMGVKLEERNIVQVSMNLTNYGKTAIYRAHEMVKMEARRYGVPVVGAEIVGLLPMQALIDCADYYLQLENFDSNQILEKRVGE